MIDGKKYLFAFLISALIFATAIFASSFLDNKKLEEVKSIGDRVAIDILSLETQFALLEETSCRDIGTGYLSKELSPLGEKLAFAEKEQGFRSEAVDDLKRSYFLLEIKDYLLMKRVTEKCGTRPTFILYFYDNSGDCPDCERAGYILTALRDKYPDLRVYSFDYNFDLEAIKTLRTIYKVEPKLPAFIINGDPYYGFRTLEELEESVPALKRLRDEKEKAEALEASRARATSTGTTTPR